MIAIWDEWWEDWEYCTYPIHSGMSRVFYWPQHRTLSTKHPLALCCMRSTGCWISADESQFWKFLGSPRGMQAQDLQPTQPLCLFAQNISDSILNNLQQLFRDHDNKVRSTCVKEFLSETRIEMRSKRPEHRALLCLIILYLHFSSSTIHSKLPKERVCAEISRL